ncbi:dienelactone hydrolase [Amylostereum chailletii]|nr:dienelactone hydrolase [Amylostereum chailletii]
MSSNEVLADAPGECCIKTIHHEGEARGTFIDLGGLQTYISRPPPQTGPSQPERYDRILFVFSDVFGPSYLNTQLVMDYFASFGYLVLSPDYFEGAPVQSLGYPLNPDFNIRTWIGPMRARADETVASWVPAAKATFGKESTKYVAVGYCFGAPDVLRGLATEAFVAGAVAHPAMLTEDHFRNIKKPLALGCAEEDHTFPRPARHRAEELLVEHRAAYYFQVFSGIRHGFATRADPNVEHERWAKEECAKGFVAWFERFCK